MSRNSPTILAGEEKRPSVLETQKSSPFPSLSVLNRALEEQVRLGQGRHSEILIDLISQTLAQCLLRWQELIRALEKLKYLIFTTALLEQVLLLKSILQMRK